MKAVVLAVLVVSTPLWADCPTHPPAGHFVEGVVLVQFRPGTDRGARMRELHASENRRIPIGDHMVERWNVADTRKAVVALSKRADVVYAEPDWDGYDLDRVPNDPLFPKFQWEGNSPTSTCGAEGVTGVAWCTGACPIRPDADIALEQAWDISTGSRTIVVGDQEGEPDWTHPDRAAARFVNPGENCGSNDPNIVCAQRTDGVDNDANGKIDDAFGWSYFLNQPAGRSLEAVTAHATAVHGMIGGGGNNGYGGVGVNWNVSIMPILPASLAGYSEAYDYAESLGVRGINMSFGAPTFSQTFHDVICAHPNILFTISSGNTGVDIDDGIHFQYPANYDCPNIITVGSSNCVINSNGLLNFNWGVKSVDLVSPGTGIYTDAGPLSPGPCLPPGRVASGCATNCVGCMRGAPACLPNDDPTFANACGAITFQNGTSFSAPGVLGAAALGWSVNPAMTPLQMKAAILSTVDVYPQYVGKYVTGGKLNVYRLLQAVSQPGQTAGEVTVAWR